MEYLEMEKLCEACGEEFYQGDPRTKYCYKCSGNPTRIKKYKQKAKKLWDKEQELDRLIAKEKERIYLHFYYIKNKRWIKERQKQKYIKDNLTNKI